jgi:hypothetical protein
MMKKRQNAPKISKKRCLLKKIRKEREKERTFMIDKDHTKTHQVPTKKFLLYHTIKGTHVTGCTQKGQVVILNSKHLTYFPKNILPLPKPCYNP